jgi:predicted small metal-binding protein
MPLELVCHACDLWLQADSEAELVDLGIQHALSLHGHAPPREHVLARIRHHNT